MDLLWALTFSIFGTVVLQEAAARLSIVSGKNIGEILSSGKGRKWGQLTLVFLSVAFGCAAYQAGNMLGAVAGLQLFSNVSKANGTVAIFIIGFLLLLSSNYKVITTALGSAVAIMGFAFIYVALQTDISAFTFATKAFTPSLPKGGSLLLIGLIGTTMVPYNIFLGKGISHGQELHQMRFGLIIAILIGGIISMSIMVVGTEVSGIFSFDTLAATITDKGGKALGLLFGIGLAAAGLSSSITSPLAAAVTAKSTFNDERNLWNEKSMNFKAVWITIMFIGLVLGLSGLKVIPVIIAAQAINGFLLPIVACYLLIIVNRREIMGAYANSLTLNIFSLFIIGICFFVGLNNIFSAGIKIFGSSAFLVSIKAKIFLSLIGVIMMAIKLFLLNKKKIQ